MKLVKKELKYRGRLISVYEETWEDGGKTYFREVVEHPGAVAMLPYSGNKLFLIRQYRQAVRESLLEIPAGLIEPGEKPEEAAVRETEEEVGYEVRSVTKLLELYSSPGFSNEVICLYACEIDPEKRSEQPPDEDEQIEVVEVGLNAALDMIWSKVIRDFKTVTSILCFNEMQKKKDECISTD